MKAMKLAAIVLLAGTFLTYIRSGRDFNIVQALPFSDGEPVNIYHWAAFAILIITCWGIYRLTHKPDDDEE